MSQDDLAMLSATDLVARYRTKTLSPVEVTEAVLARIKRFDGAVNAFVLTDPERALADAQASEARWAKGAPAGLVDGVPATIKDLVMAKGWPMQRGSRTSSPEPIAGWTRRGIKSCPASCTGGAATPSRLSRFTR